MIQCHSLIFLFDNDLKMKVKESMEKDLKSFARHDTYHHRFIQRHRDRERRRRKKRLRMYSGQTQTAESVGSTTLATRREFLLNSNGKPQIIQAGYLDFLSYLISSYQWLVSEKRRFVLLQRFHSTERGLPAFHRRMRTAPTTRIPNQPLVPLLATT